MLESVKPGGQFRPSMEMAVADFRVSTNELGFQRDLVVIEVRDKDGSLMATFELRRNDIGIRRRCSKKLVRVSYTQAVRKLIR